MLSVLVIDDERDLLDLIRHFLERFGDMHADITTSTKEALTKVDQNEYDAIVVDYCMPEITGLDFLKILRAKGNTIPIIIFSGSVQEQAAIEALNNGADFFLQKGDDPRNQFRDIVHMIRQARDRRQVGRSPGTSRRLIADLMTFSMDAMMAIDREGTVIAWNEPMEALSGVPADMMIGKKDQAYAEPFFGRKKMMPVDLVSASDDELAAENYHPVSREKGAVIAWIRVVRPDVDDRVLWMRAMQLYDGKGMYIATVMSVRDITGTAGTILRDAAAADPQKRSAAPAASAGTARLINRLTGRAKSEYKAGIRLCYDEGKYDEALLHFDRALEINPSFAPAWNDRGLCLRDLGKYEEAFKSYERALELAPREEEYLFDYGEILEMMGVLRRERKILEDAIRAFSTVTEVNPDNAHAWNHLGTCLRETGRDEEAGKAFERARSITRLNRDRMFRRKRETLI